MRKKISDLFKVSLLFLSMLVILIMITKSNVYSSSFKFNVTASKTRLKPGETTIVTMKISDILDDNNLGINALESILEYDKNVLEVITTEDIAGKNNWAIVYNTEKQNFLASNIISGVKEEQEIGEIKFKVKDNIEPTKTKIRFKNVKSNDGNNLINEGDKEIELIIYKDEVEEKNESIKVDETISSTGNTSNKEHIKYINDALSGPIPKAGEINSTKGFIIFIVIVIAILSYIRYRNIDR